MPRYIIELRGDARKLTRKGVRAHSPACDPCAIEDQDGELGECKACGSWYFKVCNGGHWQRIA